MSNPFFITDAERMTATQILDKFSLEDKYNNCFHVGCFSGRATIHAQQQRAVNLAWALNEELDLKLKKRIAIVGAGFAGITLASMLHALGCSGKVKIYDESGEALHLQRGNLTRFVQPFVYDWPKYGSGYPRTQIPYLNWWSGVVGDVVTRVLSQWNRLNIPVEDRQIKRIIPGNPIKLHFSDGKIEDCDLLVAAVGYGLEKGVDGTSTFSYWNNDALTQSLLGKKIPIRILISGGGDGGLIDVTRAVVKDFNHESFIHKYIHHPKLSNTTDDLTNIQTNLINEFNTVHRQAKDVGKDWRLLDFPKDLLDRVEPDLRTAKEVEVLFLCKEDWFTNEGTSIFNRLLVAMLWHLGRVSIEHSRLGNKLPVRDKWITWIPRPGQLPISIFDHVVTRHGLDPALKKLLYGNIWIEAQSKWSDERESPDLDTTWKNHCPEHFLKDEFMKLRGEKGYRLVFDFDNKAAADAFLEQRLEDISPGSVTHKFVSVDGSSALDIEFSSRESLDKFMRDSTRSYRSYGVYIDSKYCAEKETEFKPYTKIYFPGPAIRLESFDCAGGHKLVMACQTHPKYPLLDAHNILDATALLEIFRKEWTTRKMVEVGWRLTSSTAENWRSFRHWGV